MNTFEIRPSTPTSAERERLVQQALDILSAAREDNAAIRPNDIVLWRGSNPLCPMYVRVVKVYCNDTVKVQSLCVPGVQWKLRLDEVVMGLAPGAVE